MNEVASFAEAWIEKDRAKVFGNKPKVASFAEAWIEKNYFLKLLTNGGKSPPSRRRGLKMVCKNEICIERSVASFAEAWIENYFKMLAQKYVTRRLLRGGVD